MEKWEDFLLLFASPRRPDRVMTGLAGVCHESERTMTQEREWDDPVASSRCPKRTGAQGGGGSLECFLAGRDLFCGNVWVKAWRANHILWLTLQLLKFKYRRFLCMNAKPFPVSLTVSYKNNHCGIGDKLMIQSSSATGGQRHLSLSSGKSPGQTSELKVTAWFGTQLPLSKWWPIIDLVHGAPFSPKTFTRSHRKLVSGHGLQPPRTHASFLQDEIPIWANAVTYLI